MTNRAPADVHDVSSRQRSERSGESIVTRVVRILDTFTPEHPSRSVSEVARQTDLPLATASRLIAQLVEADLLARAPDRRVSVGLRLWQLAARAQPALSLREIAMPFMAVLHASVRQHTQLGVLDGDQVLFVERLRAPGAVVNFTTVAGRLSLHASSSGLVLLAHATPDLREQIMASALPAYTKATPSDPRRLRELLAAVRRDGSILCRGFLHDDAAGLAVPLRGPQGTVVAALSVIVPNGPQAAAPMAALVECGRQIERALSLSEREVAAFTARPSSSVEEHNQQEASGDDDVHPHQH